jgi:hypothetical protein
LGPNRLWKITCIYAEYFFIRVNIYVGGGNSNAGHAYFRVFFISASLLSHFIVRLPYVVRYWTMRKSSLFSWNTAVLWCYLRPGRYSGKSIGSTRKMDNCTNTGAAAICQFQMLTYYWLINILLFEVLNYTWWLLSFILRW